MLRFVLFPVVPANLSAVVRCAPPWQIWWGLCLLLCSGRDREMVGYRDGGSWGSLACSLFYIISVEMLCFVGFRPGTNQLVSNTVELLVHACSSEDRAIRLAASENLRKLIKVSVNISPTTGIHTLLWTRIVCVPHFKPIMYLIFPFSDNWGELLIRRIIPYAMCDST